MGVRATIRKWFRSDRPAKGGDNGSAYSSPVETTGKPPSLQPGIVNGSASPLPTESAGKVTAPESEAVNGNKPREVSHEHPPEYIEDNTPKEPGPEADPPKSLWERAYDSLDPKLVQKYEKILSTKLDKPDDLFNDHVDLDKVTNRIDRNAKSRHEQMKQITDNCLQRLDEKSIKYHIGSREYNLEDQIAKGVQLVQGMKDFISEAVRASPEASLAWTGVCLVLPMFTNPSEAKQANEEGFTYVTSRMRFYVALESLLWPDNRKKNLEGLDQVRTELEGTIVELYQQILTFQVKTILRSYERRRIIFVRDVVRYDNWEGMVDAIKALEARVHTDSKQLNVNTSRKMLEGMDESMGKYVNLMENMQGLAEKQLEVSKQQLDVNKQQLGYHERTEKRYESEKEAECHQIFRNARDDHDKGYEWYKDLVDDAVDGTLEWFLTREEFQHWEQQQTGLLVVSADPGCGKSVLAKHLMDKRLPGTSTICYFFFKDQLQNRENQALCAILHQLFSHKPELVRYAMPEYRHNGRSLVNITQVLWDILWKATSDSAAGSVVFVLDGLDECITEETPGLIDRLNRTFFDKAHEPGRAKFLVTTRPYSKIIGKFDGIMDRLSYIHIPGESQSEMISQEVNLAISQKVDQIKALRAETKEYLKQRLLEVENRTYLWVSFVVKYIESTRIKNTKDGVNKALKNLPTSVHKAYERILNKSKRGKDVTKALNLVLAAVTPLSVSEMNIAMEIDESKKSDQDLELEDDSYFKDTLRDICGLFISIKDDKVYFIHQTGRDFLLKKQPETQETGVSHWNGTFSLLMAHITLAESCIFYLQSDLARKSLQFAQYATRNWMHHLRESEMVPEGELASSVLEICDPSSDIHIRWPGLFGDLGPLCNRDALWSAVCLRLGNVIELLIKKQEVDFESKHFGECTPLAYAAREGYDDIVQILLKSGRVRVNPKAAHRRTPLILAIKEQHESTAKLLLTAKDVNLDARDESGRSVLSWAAARGYTSIVQFLLGCDDVDPNAVDRNGKTPLLWAVIQEEMLVVRLLLQSGRVDPNVQDKRGRTALSWATKHEYGAIVELLLQSERTDPTLADQDDD